MIDVYLPPCFSSTATAKNNSSVFVELRVLIK